MSAVTRRRFGIAAVAILAVCVAPYLAGCGDPEPEQRKAFMAFLQGMIDRPGVHVMNAKADDDKTFGEYAKHYAVILDFNKELAVVMAEFANNMKRMGLDQATPRTIEQMVSHRADIVAASEGMTKSQTAMDARLATAQTARAALKQPDDLKKVYDAAFDKLVVAPVHGVDKTYAVLGDGVKVSLQLVDYVAAHPGKLTISGSQIRASDAKTLAEMNELLKAHNAAGVKLEEAKRELQRIVEGS